MEHRAEELKRRTKSFALRIIRLVRAIPGSPEKRVIADQLLRSGLSVAANYWAVCRSRSRAEFVAKMSVVIEEADETVFWLQLLEDAGLIAAKRLINLKSEANQLVEIFNASRATARKATKSEISNQKSAIPEQKAS